MTVCTHCKARHWECERTKLTGHFSTCCSQGKVQLPPSLRPNPNFQQLLEGSDSGIPAFRENARSYNNALSFTSLAAHFDQTRPGTQGPRMFCVFAFAHIWLIDPAEATDTRLGPDDADSRIQRSTLTKLESMLRTKNHFVREFASAKTRAGWDTAKESALRLCLPPGRDRRTHNLPTSSTEMAMLICDSETNTGDRGPQDLILQVHGDRCPDGRPNHYYFLQGKMASTPTLSLCGFRQAGLPIARNREQIDNGVQSREVLAGLGLDDEGEEEDEDREDEDEDGEEGDEEDGDGERQVKGSRWRVSRSQLFAHYLPNATSTSQSRIAPNVPSWKNLRLTTTQGINGLTPNQIGRSMTLGSTFKNRPRDITQRYQDAMACVVKHGKPPLLITMSHDPESPEIKAALGPNDKACNRPDLIA
ncbi:BZ3500_MvSof-1268-A1-R1_Chr4-2g06908 [Microbotryum saponariae]|uniref:BZ3500_MvSof-1268-A1-R1_Chr4-2g06908 protein n=1 Tax=Microbotryum saponariae TaxID=289078 RepID=A0A2X0M3L6_9BASI|nr:BZ3500_MvSof-1268-A1-R1_Chr4-2g06908 [Microbotryum saponariae]SDA06573.1 BZ3501_MvSof-1269-A2-R1_Chr4-2g06619 [Microbotryum saponariae]